MAETSYTYTDPAFPFLKADLGYLGEAPQEVCSFMEGRLTMARADLARCGVDTSGDTVEDLQLVAMYAAWLYRKRDSGEGKPQMLRTAIHDRQVARATKREGEP